MSLHTFTAYTRDDAEFLVRFERSPAQRQTLEDPGFPEEIEVIEVNFGRGWEDVSDYPSLDLITLNEAAAWHWELLKEANQCEREKECEA